METTRWTNPSQPQTLQSAVILLYVNAVLGVVFGFSSFGLLLAGGRIAAGWACANERKWGYQLGVAVAALPFLLLFAFNSLSSIADNLGTVFVVFAFDIVLLVLLLHPMSRSYQRIWFR